MFVKKNIHSFATNLIYMKRKRKGDEEGGEEKIDFQGPNSHK